MPNRHCGNVFETVNWQDANFAEQVPIGKYIVDFVCFETKVVIEVDGGHHSEQARYDADRTTWLESQGFRVLRFWNHEVLADTEAVQEALLMALQERSPSPDSPSPQPSPIKGEGIKFPLPSFLSLDGRGF